MSMTIYRGKLEHQKQYLMMSTDFSNSIVQVNLFDIFKELSEGKAKLERSPAGEIWISTSADMDNNWLRISPNGELEIGTPSP